jgi:hypothetical protein
MSAETKGSCSLEVGLLARPLESKVLTCQDTESQGRGQWVYLTSTLLKRSGFTWSHLDVTASSASPERHFSSVGLVKSDLRGSLLDTTLIDVMWGKQAS